MASGVHAHDGRGRLACKDVPHRGRHCGDDCGEAYAWRCIDGRMPPIPLLEGCGCLYGVGEAWPPSSPRTSLPLRVQCAQRISLMPAREKLHGWSFLLTFTSWIRFRH